MARYLVNKRGLLCLIRVFRRLGFFECELQIGG